MHFNKEFLILLVLGEVISFEAFHEAYYSWQDFVITLEPENEGSKQHRDGRKQN